MNLDQLKNFLTQLEAERRGDHKEEETKVYYSSRGRAQKKTEEKCHRCNKTGHWRTECNLEKTEYWYCYWCQDIVKHNGTECPSPEAQEYRRQNRRYSNPRGNSNYRGNSRGNGNSRGRSNFRGRNARGNFSQRNSQNQSKENSLHKINVRVRGGKIVKRKIENKVLPNQAYTIDYQEEHEEEDIQTEGKPNETESSDKITFIADSGATEHIINKSFILRDFKKNTCGVIRCANKNTQADMKIDAKGDLLLLPNNVSDKMFKLANVLATKDISENLL